MTGTLAIAAVALMIWPAAAAPVSCPGGVWPPGALSSVGVGLGAWRVEDGSGRVIQRVERRAIDGMGVVLIEVLPDGRECVLSAPEKGPGA